MEFFTTMITPYTKTGEVDLDTARRYTDWYFDAGLSGIFAVCQSSEIFCLTLEERTALNRAVYARAKEREKESGRRFTVISSGHVSDTLAEQARELNAVAASGTDALILITNRLAARDEDDGVWIARAKALLAELPRDIPLGLYECPYPYKRLVSPRVFDWCMETGRFRYMKDTCCDAALIAARCRQTRGSGLRLFNANCQTLLESMKSGADGYCGIMCNFHPRLYTWLMRHYLDEPERAEELQAFLGTFGFTEGGIPYPLTAKYHMTLCGIPTELTARTRPGEELTEYAKDCVRQMKRATDRLEAEFPL